MEIFILEKIWKWLFPDKPKQVIQKNSRSHNIQIGGSLNVNGDLVFGDRIIQQQTQIDSEVKNEHFYAKH